MAVFILSGDRQVKAGTFDAVQVLSGSTATARQRISGVIPVTTIAGSTATSGPNFNNLFTVPGATATEPPVEGMIKIIKSLATGPAAFIVFESMATGRSGIPEIATNATGGGAVQVYTAASATGAFVFSDASHFIYAMYLNAQWNVLGGLATYGTGT